MYKKHRQFGIAREADAFLLDKSLLLRGRVSISSYEKRRRDGHKASAVNSQILLALAAMVGSRTSSTECHMGSGITECI
jgi:hypothetical protein